MLPALRAQETCRGSLGSQRGCVSDLHNKVLFFFLGGGGGGGGKLPAKRHPLCPAGTLAHLPLQATGTGWSNSSFDSCNPTMILKDIATLQGTVQRMLRLVGATRTRTNRENRGEARKWSDPVLAWVALPPILDANRPSAPSIQRATRRR